ncbi:sn-glycerol-3-phosphate ABC transporter substrate-binding protein UgpB [Lacibacterium aquatile]|uniref:sn-glycerol-3-phosphate-binding periplasmic protein UgpB n=1 Tax=Lacibacterium aquatile TaxID=1168082 RepID=A0ABW5DXF3_9PROT
MRILTSAVAVAALMAGTAHAAPMEIQWWHAMTGANNDRVNELVTEFNASQADYKVVPVFKNSYDELLNQLIAAYRAGNAPHIAQVFEVGTATMMGAKGAVKPVFEVMAEAGEKFDPKSYMPSIAAYYSTADGKMLSMPYNSSTSISYYNKDIFKKAGLDPEKAPATWPEWFAAAKKIRETGAANCGFTVAWMTWTQMEQVSAWHNIPYGTQANGFKGFDTEFKFNNPLIVKHLDTLNQLQKDNVFVYGGRTTQPEAKFLSGECGMMQGSSGTTGTLDKAGLNYGTGFLPYYPDVAGAPQNSIIGGATLWTMGGKKPEEYKGVAKFFSYLSTLPVQVVNHQKTGYLPITLAAYEETKKSGFYDKNPARETPVKELLNKAPTENSMGVRFGNLAKVRDLIMDEVEGAFAGKQTMQQALDNAVAKSNDELRRFERTANR